MYIQNEDLVGLKLGEWEAEEDSFIGVIEWRNPYVDYYLCATPNWEEDGKVPFEVYDNDGECESPLVLNLSGDKDQQLTSYLKAVKMVLGIN